MSNDKVEKSGESMNDNKVEKNDESKKKDSKTNKPSKSDKAKKKTKEMIFTVFFMFIVTFIFISVLAVVNLFTQDRIKTNEKLRLQKSILIASGVDVPESIEDIQSYFTGSNLDPKPLSKKDDEGPVIVSGYYEVKIGDDSAYVFRSAGPGLWGEIEALIGIDSLGEKILGFEVYKQNETPGLGARITEQGFKDQFKGLEIPDRGFEYVGEDEDASPSQFNGLTGASNTVRFIRNIINDTLNMAKAELHN